MNQFTLVRPDSHAAAATVLASGDYRLPVLKAGGMDIVDHLKEGLLEPDALVDIKRVRRAPGAALVERQGGRLLIDASATLAEIGDDPLVREFAPVVSESATSAATPQVRAVASVAGNLLQRPRCWYYRHAQFDCLKKGGDRCFAIEGENAYHAIFGGASCHIVHPSNLAVAMSVLDGAVHVIGGDRDRIEVGDLFTPPSRGVRTEHALEPGEVITHLSVDAAPMSDYLAIKHKQSFDWPLVSAAAAIELDAGRIRGARICAGAVAPIPWRLPKIERALVGVDPRDEAGLRKACAGAADGARPMRDNEYKVSLLPVVVRRAVRRAAGLPAVEDA